MSLIIKRNIQLSFYQQGMSDILSPLLIVMKDEGQAYISFCSLMSRMAGNFFSDGKLMTTKFEHLSQLIQHIDPEFYSYLKFRHSDDLLFCYRWLLLELKREFRYATYLLYNFTDFPPHLRTYLTVLR